MSDLYFTSIVGPFLFLLLCICCCWGRQRVKMFLFSHVVCIYVVYMSRPLVHIRATWIFIFIPHRVPTLCFHERWCLWSTRGPRMRWCGITTPHRRCESPMMPAYWVDFTRMHPKKDVHKLIRAKVRHWIYIYISIYIVYSLRRYVDVGSKWNAGKIFLHVCVCV